jgi:hypothetical protein
MQFSSVCSAEHENPFGPSHMPRDNGSALVKILGEIPRMGTGNTEIDLFSDRD